MKPIYLDRYHTGWGIAMREDIRYKNWGVVAATMLTIIATFYGMRLLTNYQALRTICDFHCQPTWHEVTSI